MRVKVFLQNHKGSRIRNKYNEKTLEYIEAAELLAAAAYQYGFIPGTSGEDNDCLDVWLISEQDYEVGRIIECNVIGMLEMFEEYRGEREEDFKIIVRPENDGIISPQTAVEEIKVFTIEIFKRYPEVKISFGGFLPADEAAIYIKNQLL